MFENSAAEEAFSIMSEGLGKNNSTIILCVCAFCISIAIVGVAYCIFRSIKAVAERKNKDA